MTVTCQDFFKLSFFIAHYVNKDIFKSMYYRNISQCLMLLNSMENYIHFIIIYFVFLTTIFINYILQILTYS